MSPTSTLAAFINHATDRLLQRADVKASPSNSNHSRWDSLIFLGNLHDVVPRRLLLDSILNPREKFAWQLIRLHATDNNTGAAFPSYDELQIQLSNYPVKEKASRSTVSLTLLTLRLTRWLSLCHRARDKRNGRILGNIYVLHDEPLTLLDAQTFDPDYLKLLAHCICHANPRLRSVAEELLVTIHSDNTLKYLSSRMSLIEERIIWQQERAMAQSAQETKHKSPNFSAESYNKTQPKSPNFNKELRPKNGSLPLKSNKKTTVLRQDSITTLQSSKKRKLQVPRANGKLQWPEVITLQAHEIQLVQQIIHQLDLALAQAVLDDTAARISRGGIQNPAAYLLATLKRAKKGEFNALSKHSSTISPPISTSHHPAEQDTFRSSDPQNVLAILNEIKNRIKLVKGR